MSARPAPGAAALLAAWAIGCSPPFARSECAVDAECGEKLWCTAGRCLAVPPVCDAPVPTFASINAKIFQVGCGTRTNGCHGGDPAENRSGLDLATDPYRALLGANGQGSPASNVDGSELGLLLVKPGARRRSFLATKLRLPKLGDKAYGAPMTTEEGFLCEASIRAIEQWIGEGAKDN